MRSTTWNQPKRPNLTFFSSFPQLTTPSESALSALSSVIIFLKSQRVLAVHLSIDFPHSNDRWLDIIYARYKPLVCDECLKAIIQSENPILPHIGTCLDQTALGLMNEMCY